MNGPPAPAGPRRPARCGAVFLPRKRTAPPTAASWLPASRGAGGRQAAVGVGGGRPAGWAAGRVERSAAPRVAYPRIRGRSSQKNS